jgi:hypothetical protein
MQQGRTVHRSLIVAAASLLPYLAASAATPPMPAEVTAHIEGMKDSCRQAGGEPIEPKASFLISADLNGDGQTDWAIDEAGFNCDGAWSTFSGSGGSQVYVFAGMPGNTAPQAFVHGAYGMRLERTGGHSRLWLSVGGKLCGQSGLPSHAEAIQCERPLAWNKATRTFKFGPLSTIKILDRGGPAR